MGETPWRFKSSLRHKSSDFLFSFTHFHSLVHVLAVDSAALAAFLADPTRPDSTPSYHAVQGLLFAIACAPEIILPSEWLPLIIDFEAGDAESAAPGEDELSDALERLLALYETINSAVLTGDYELPADCQFRAPMLANFDEDAPIAQWSRGFVLGYGYSQEVWENHLQNEIDSDFNLSFITLAFFASREAAERMALETASSAAEGMSESLALDSFATKFSLLFSRALNSYAEIGLTVREAVRDMNSAAQEPVRSTKIGRNQPCPCGSGKKYKKCCGA